MELSFLYTSPIKKVSMYFNAYFFPLPQTQALKSNYSEVHV